MMFRSLAKQITILTVDNSCTISFERAFFFQMQLSSEKVCGLLTPADVEKVFLFCD